ncbi:class D beta-lactamase [Halomonas nitroreducens]|uniref:Beta-lactamase n=1 Tax=Halomonas nitroreducens TaxID=447425 RepID=A0A3S0HRG6_9GAMM|nr:class D beta-lactamase [Halomonas nitroreducens]RTQ99866.1 class D beta-lactamase [Halomonas nitroreducens]
MRRLPTLLGLTLLTLLPIPALAGDWQPRPDWAELFAEHGVENGTLVIVDQREGREGLWVVNPERAGERLSPASTFKVPHALFALDAGVVEDEFEVFPWDGVERDVPAWNQDQTLRSALRYSTVWVFQRLADQIGRERERAYLSEIGYGNATVGDDVERFWLDGSLRVTALEQVDFLERLYAMALPFAESDQRLVKDIMINEAGRDWILRAKSGWDGRVGWWVGWVERPSGPVFFALNLDTPERLADLPKREAITRAVLRRLEALPAAE